MKIIFK